ncbi:MAG: alpha/beta fold hydrolase [Polyangiales bacterium]
MSDIGAPRLASTIVEPASGARPDRAVLFLHGILGQGSNFRSIARRTVDALAVEGRSWRAVLVDLRAHGASQGFSPPHTIRACAEDLEALAHALDLPVAGVVGHSFGGKVALSFAEIHRVGSLVLLDSSPGPRVDARGSESTVAVVELLVSMPRSFPTRAAFVDRLVGAGHAEAFAQWLAMNLVRDGEAFTNRLEMPVIRALLDDYFAVDLWRVLEREGVLGQWDVVLGETSRVFDDADRRRLDRCVAQAPSARRVAVLEGAGHWVHVDAPDRTVALLVAALERAD